MSQDFNEIQIFHENLNIFIDDKKFDFLNIFNLINNKVRTTDSKNMFVFPNNTNNFRYKIQIRF